MSKKRANSVRKQSIKMSDFEMNKDTLRENLMNDADTITLSSEDEDQTLSNNLSGLKNYISKPRNQNTIQQFVVSKTQNDINNQPSPELAIVVQENPNKKIKLSETQSNVKTIPKRGRRSVITSGLDRVMNITNDEVNLPEIAQEETTRKRNKHTLHQQKTTSIDDLECIEEKVIPDHKISSHTLPKSVAQSLTLCLIAWYRQKARKLPWRSTYTVPTIDGDTIRYRHDSLQIPYLYQEPSFPHMLSDNKQAKNDDTQTVADHDTIDSYGPYNQCSVYVLLCYILKYTLVATWKQQQNQKQEQRQQGTCAISTTTLNNTVDKMGVIRRKGLDALQIYQIVDILREFSKLTSKSYDNEEIDIFASKLTDDTSTPVSTPLCTLYDLHKYASFLPQSISDPLLFARVRYHEGILSIPVDLLHRIIIFLNNPSLVTELTSETRDKCDIEELNSRSASHIMSIFSLFSPFMKGWDEQTWAYRVLTSEIMLQQTRVATVLNYYSRWFETLPSVHILAKASEDTVQSLWAGLGFYRRARMLHKGAQYITELVGGSETISDDTKIMNNIAVITIDSEEEDSIKPASVTKRSRSIKSKTSNKHTKAKETAQTTLIKGQNIPQSISGLLKIPGIGAYTAGAVGSNVFGIHAHAVDTNVIRVLSRVIAFRIKAMDVKSMNLIQNTSQTCLNAIKGAGHADIAMYDYEYTSRIRMKDMKSLKNMQDMEDIGDIENIENIDSQYSNYNENLRHYLLGYHENFSDQFLSGEFNQALMDLGNSVCTIKNPSCEKCPINIYCGSYAEEISQQRYLPSGKLFNVDHATYVEKKSNGKYRTKQHKYVHIQVENDDVSNLNEYDMAYRADPSLAERIEKDMSNNNLQLRHSPNNQDILDNQDNQDNQGRSGIKLVPIQKLTTDPDSVECLLCLPVYPPYSVSQYTIMKKTSSMAKEKEEFLTYVLCRQVFHEKSTLNRSTIECLLIKRPKKGLLAGQYDFPKVALVHNLQRHSLLSENLKENMKENMKEIGNKDSNYCDNDTKSLISFDQYDSSPLCHSDMDLKTFHDLATLAENEAKNSKHSQNDKGSKNSKTNKNSKNAKAMHPVEPQTRKSSGLQAWLQSSKSLSIKDEISEVKHKMSKKVGTNFEEINTTNDNQYRPILTFPLPLEKSPIIRSNCLNNYVSLMFSTHHDEILQYLSQKVPAIHNVEGSINKGCELYDEKSRGKDNLVEYLGITGEIEWEFTHRLHHMHTIIGWLPSIEYVDRNNEALCLVNLKETIATTSMNTSLSSLEWAPLFDIIIDTSNEFNDKSNKESTSKLSPLASPTISTSTTIETRIQEAIQKFGLTSGVVRVIEQTICSLTHHLNQDPLHNFILCTQNDTDSIYKKIAKPKNIKNMIVDGEVIDKMEITIEKQKSCSTCNFNFKKKI